METNRQKKISKLIQKEVIDILQGQVRQNAISNLIISVPIVWTRSDLSLSKIYLSVFPSEQSGEIMTAINSNTPVVKHDLAQRVKNQLRIVRALRLYID